MVLCFPARKDPVGSLTEALFGIGDMRLGGGGVPLGGGGVLFDGGGVQFGGGVMRDDIRRSGS